MANAEKKRIKSWFMQNIILPNNEIIDKPGFIIYQFNEQDKNAFMREVLVPETILADIESRAVREFGEKGHRALYRAGKRWGYRFANGALFPQFSKSSEKDVLDFLAAFTKVIEAEYSEKFAHELDFKRRVVTFRGDNMVICKYSGDGGIFLGAWVGCWAYQNDDPTFEGVQSECQGRKDKQCVFVCGPRSEIKVKEDIPLDESSRIEAPQFYSLNSPAHAARSDFSLKRFMELGHITYDGGFFRFGNERLVLNESSYLYFMGDELGKIGAEDVIFESAFDYFSEFAKNHTREFFIGFLMASGFGQVEILKERKGYSARIRNYPWTSMAKKAGFPLIRGMISGYLSGKEGRKVALKNFTSSTADGRLDIIMRERI